MKSQNKTKNPSLKLRYSRGLGDIIACILHSKLFGWLTHLITGKKEPCKTCSARANALNVLFPIPIWKIFFKNVEELTYALAEDLKSSGYETQITKDGKGVSATKFSEKEHNDNLKTEDDIKKRADIENYTLISKSSDIIGDFLFEIKIYKYN